MAIVVLLGILSAAVIAALFNSPACSTTGTRIVKLDSARTAINQVGRYIRTSSDTTDHASNSIAGPASGFGFYVDLDGDGGGKPAITWRRHVKMQMADRRVTSPAPGWTYGGYETDGIISRGRAERD